MSDEKRDAWFWKVSEDGPFHCLVFFNDQQDPEQRSVEVVGSTWRALRRTMRDIGIDPGDTRESEVKVAMQFSSKGTHPGRRSVLVG